MSKWVAIVCFGHVSCVINFFTVQFWSTPAMATTGLPSVQVVGLLSYFLAVLYLFTLLCSSNLLDWFGFLVGCWLFFFIFSLACWLTFGVSAVGSVMAFNYRTIPTRHELKIAEVWCVWQQSALPGSERVTRCLRLLPSLICCRLAYSCCLLPISSPSNACTHSLINVSQIITCRSSLGARIEGTHYWWPCPSCCCCVVPASGQHVNPFPTEQGASSSDVPSPFVSKVLNLFCINNIFLEWFMIMVPHPQF